MKELSLFEIMPAAFTLAIFADHYAKILILVFETLGLESQKWLKFIRSVGLHDFNI